jgi:hypothetical protein
MSETWKPIPGFEGFLGTGRWNVQQMLAGTRRAHG